MRLFLNAILSMFVPSFLLAGTLATAAIKIKHRATPDETLVMGAPEVRRIPHVGIVVR